MKILLPFFLLLFVLACGDPDARIDNDEVGEVNPELTDDEPDMDDRDMDDRDMAGMAAGGSGLVQSTVQAVQSAGGDITALNPQTAVSNIDSWINELRNMDGTDEIVGELNSLQTELQADNIDGGRVSELLSSLADQTRAMEGQAPGLGTLASALQAGADKLGSR